MTTIKLRHHHINSLYGFVYKHSERQYRKDLAFLKYTKSERDYIIKKVTEIQNMPKDTLIEVIDSEDIICEGCTRKHDEERAEACCYGPEEFLTLDDPTVSFHVIMNIKVFFY